MAGLWLHFADPPALDVELEATGEAPAIDKP